MFRKIGFLLLLVLLPTLSFSQDSNKKVVDKDIVSNLKAVLSPDLISIDLTWTPPEEEGEVIIARSTEVIDTPEKLGVADSLGKYKNTKANPFNSFKDQNLKPGDYYYAIALVAQIRKKRVKLYAGTNYTIVPVTIKETVEADTPKVVTPKLDTSEEIDSVDHLKVKNYNNIVSLNWSPPQSADKNFPKYTIYRSMEPMNNIGLLDKATRIGEVEHPITSFDDIGLNSSQTVYYGVSVTIKGKEKIPLVEDKSFRKFYFVKIEKKEEEKPIIAEPKAEEKIEVLPEKKEIVRIEPKYLQIENLSAEVREDGVMLTWSAPKEAVENSTTYYIYESKKPFINEFNSRITEKAIRIGTVVHPDLFFLHPRTGKAGTSYYGVTTKTQDDPENTVVKNGQSYIRFEYKPIKITKPKIIKQPEIKPEESEPKVVEKPKAEKEPIVTADESNPDFDTIMAQYYKREKYKEASVKFKSLADRTNDNSIKGKSLFFFALCHYNLSEYDTALKILLKEEVQLNYNKERIDFYVKRCLENRGKR